MQRVYTPRYYLMHPQTGKFRAWNGEWVAWAAAQDFSEYARAAKIAEELANPTMIMQLISTN
jgi:hypothetical protein